MVQLGLRRESFGVDDLTWLGSRRGVDTARTATIDLSAWKSANKVTFGNYIKSGEPAKFATVGGKQKLVPYAGSGTLAGFILTPTHVDPRLTDADADIVVPLLDFGRIVVANLPSGHQVGANPTTSGQFVWV